MEKRLLCIISSLNTGGAETFLMKVYRALDRLKFQMDFVVSADGFYDEEVKALGGKIFRVPLRTAHPIKVFKEIRRIVKDNGYYSVLKVGNSPLCVVDLIAAKMGGAKICAMRSCNAPTSLSLRQKISDFVFRPILNRVANVKIAPSDLAASYTFGKKSFQNGDVELLHNGVNLDSFYYDEIEREKKRKEFSLTDNTVIGHIGRFNKQKNHTFLLSVFFEIKKNNKNAKLLLVGTGELEGAIREQAAQLGILDDIVFTGIRTDVSALLSAMDVFVFPSFHEGMPNTVIEAQATGLPCVIADTITREANITGLVEYLPLGDARFWAERALQTAKMQRAETHQIFVKEKYDIESTAKAFVKLLLGE